MGLLEGKRVLVTGVLVESSIAFHVARLAQQEGATVVLTSFGRQLRLTQSIARRLPSTPPVVELDVTNTEHLDGPRRRASASTSTGSTESCTRSPSRRRARSAATSWRPSGRTSPPRCTCRPTR